MAYMMGSIEVFDMQNIYDKPQGVRTHSEHADALTKSFAGEMCVSDHQYSDQYNDQYSDQYSTVSSDSVVPQSTQVTQVKEDDRRKTRLDVPREVDKIDKSGTSGSDSGINSADEIFSSRVDRFVSKYHELTLRKIAI